MAGRNYLQRSDGNLQELRGSDTAEVFPGDMFVVETPGGGGFGDATAMTRAAE